MSYDDGYQQQQHKVIKTKSVEYMPFFLSLANFANGAVWTAYGLIKFDKFIVVIILFFIVLIFLISRPGWWFFVFVFLF